jgi:hypothetical protein
MDEQPAASSPSKLVAGPPWAPAINDLARLRAVTSKTSALIHSHVRGASMGAAIPSGARIRIRTGPEQTWQRGQVIAFLAGSRVTVHRIVYEGQHGPARQFVLTQGDGNWLCDPPVNRSTVVGEVEAFSTGNEWHAIGAPRIRFHRRLVGGLSQALMRLALEHSPAFAISISRPISWLRMGPRLALSILRRVRAELRRLRADHVRD